MGVLDIYFIFHSNPPLLRLLAEGGNIEPHPLARGGVRCRTLLQHHLLYLAGTTYGSSMVRYVILRKNLQEIPSSISFRPARLSAWLFAKRGFLHSVPTPDPATWCSPSTDSPLRPEPLPSQLNDSGSLSMVPDDEDSDMASWSDNESPFHSNPNLAHCLTNDNPHSSTGHTPAGSPRLSDTCPHTCVIYNQNVNGMGYQDDKLERIIEMMIDWRIHGYCLQGTWQLGTYCKTIRDHTISITE